MSHEEWDRIGEQLRAPFDPKDVDFRVQGKRGASGKAQVVAYIDARTVQDRLDAAVGPGAWSFEWEPVVVDKGDVQIAKGTITIYGIAKSDAGTASNFEQSLGAVSHCFKRAAVHWGIGRYLYELPAAWVAVDNDNGRLSPEIISGLRAKLPRPGSTLHVVRPAPTAAGVPEAPTPDAPGTTTVASAVAAALATRPPTTPPAPTASADTAPPKRSLRERMRHLGYADEVDYEQAVRAIVGHLTPFSQDEIATLRTRIEQLESQLGTPATTAQLTSIAQLARALNRELPVTRDTGHAGLILEWMTAEYQTTRALEGLPVAGRN
jgi:hypothetical protein